MLRAACACVFIVGCAGGGGARGPSFQAGMQLEPIYVSTVLGCSPAGTSARADAVAQELARWVHVSGYTKGLTWPDDRDREHCLDIAQADIWRSDAWALSGTLRRSVQRFAAEPFHPGSREDVRTVVVPVVAPTSSPTLLRVGLLLFRADGTLLWKTSRTGDSPLMADEMHENFMELDHLLGVR